MSKKDDKNRALDKKELLELIAQSQGIFETTLKKVTNVWDTTLIRALKSLENQGSIKQMNYQKKVWVNSNLKKIDGVKANDLDVKADVFKILNQLGIKFSQIKLIDDTYLINCFNTLNGGTSLFSYKIKIINNTETDKIDLNCLNIVISDDFNQFKSIKNKDNLVYFSKKLDNLIFNNDLDNPDALKKIENKAELIRFIMGLGIFEESKSQIKIDVANHLYYLNQKNKQIYAKKEGRI